MPRRPALLAAVAVFLLALLSACGGKDDAGEESAETGDARPSRTERAAVRPEATEEPAAAEEAPEPMAQVELTDELVDQYLDILEEFAKGGSLPTLLARHQWAAERYAAVAEQFHTAVTLATMGNLSETLDQQIKELESQLAGAEGETKTYLSQALEGLKEQRKAMATEGMDSELAKRNWEVLQRHMPRFQELSARKR